MKKSELQKAEEEYSKSLGELMCFVGKNMPSCYEEFVKKYDLVQKNYDIWRKKYFETK
jgi:hypothetical protein